MKKIIYIIGLFLLNTTVYTASQTDLDSELLLSISTKNIPYIQSLITLGANINFKSKHGYTPLGAAVLSSESICQLLLEHNANPNTTEKFEITPLYKAVEHSNANICEILLQYGANPNSINTEYHKTPLYRAVEKSNENICKILLQHGADPNIITEHFLNKETPLHRAVKQSDENICKILLQHGADPNISNFNGLTSLHCAAKLTSPLPFIQLLMQNGANPTVKNYDNRTPLDILLQYQQYPAAKAILQYDTTNIFYPYEYKMHLIDQYHPFLGTIYEYNQ